MCVMSMVYDHFNDRFNGWPVYPPLVPTTVPYGDPTIIKKTIEDFHRAREAAGVVDALTQQKDCVDPEKAKLLEKVERLEKIIDALLAKTASDPVDGGEA